MRGTCEGFDRYILRFVPSRLDQAECSRHDACSVLRRNVGKETLNLQRGWEDVTAYTCLKIPKLPASVSHRVESLSELITSAYIRTRFQQHLQFIFAVNLRFATVHVLSGPLITKKNFTTLLVSLSGLEVIQFSHLPLTRQVSTLVF